MTELKRTPFFDQHRSAGARLIEFGGWEMPVQYRGIIAEHEHTRTVASLFDCSHMGQFRIRGRTAASEFDALLPRSAVDQKIGSCRYNFLLNSDGGVIDDIIVYRIAEDEFYVVVNAATQAGDLQHLRQHLSDSVELIDESANTAKLDLQGPAALDAVAGIGLPRESLPRYFRFMQAEISGVPALVSRTGYTGERGLEFYFDAAHSATVWDLLISLPGVEPAGLGARDTLRLELALPLYGHELDTETTPVEAGFGRMLDLDREFLAADALRQSPCKKLVGLVLDGRRAARAGDKVCTTAGQEIGEITSGSFGPSVGTAIALAYVRPGTVDIGTKVEIPGSRTSLAATVSELPFYRQGTARK